MAALLLVATACTRTNPGYSGDDPGEGSTTKDDGTGPPPSTEPPLTSGPVTSSGTTSGGDATTSDSTGPALDSSGGAPEPEAVYVYQGPITDGGFGNVGKETPDPGYTPCLAAANSFPDLCVSAERIASMTRMQSSLRDDLVARGVPATLPVRSPEGEPIAPNIDEMIYMGLQQPLAMTPSVWIGAPQPFWTGGRVSEDYDCSDWTLSMVAPMPMPEEMGVIGTPNTMDMTWVWADLVPCSEALPILCLCW